MPWHGLKHGPEALRGSAHPFGSEPPWDVGVSRQRRPEGRGEARRGLAPLKHFQPLGNSTEASTPRGHRTPRPHGPQASHHTYCGRILGGGCLPPTFRARRTFSMEGSRVGRLGGGGNLPVKPQVPQNYYPSASKQTPREFKRLTQKQ